MTPDRKLRILWFAGHTISAPSRSGIQRVVIEAARAIKDAAALDVIKWDSVDGQLRYADAKDMSTTFGVNSPSVNSMCHRRRYRFGDTLSPDEDTWLVFPEIPFHLQDGIRIFDRVLSQCREYGIRTAVLYYDLVPIRIDEYKSLGPRHEEYTRAILRADLIFPISNFSKTDLAHFFEKESGIKETPVLEEALHKLIALPLAGNGPIAPAACSVPDTEKRTIILVGTVEPRKQQTRFLKIFNDACERHPVLQHVKVKIFGSLHPASLPAFYAELARNKNIEYRGYGSDDEIERAYDEALFSVYPSCYEGFGLPILESLERGVPCLTANFGAMVEAAGDGGCLPVDVHDDKAVEDAIVKLVTDASLRDSLRSQIKEKKFRTWGDYARDLIRHLSEWNAAHRKPAVGFSGRFQAWLHDQSPVAHDAFKAGGLSVTLWNLGLKDEASPVQTTSCDRQTTIRITRMMPGPAHEVPREKLDILAASDILLVPSRDMLDAIVSSANTSGIDVPLPRHILVGSEQHGNAEQVAQAIFAHKSKEMEVEASERLLSNAYTTFRPQKPAEEYELAVVISTYNRADFVSMNAEWLLGQITQDNLPVVCVVVDNVSTDDTRMKLARFSQHPNFRYVCNPHNVGMLGNLQVCSCLSLSRHVWMTGDDDFIAPGALARTLSVIRNQPSIPFIFHNFAVYHREKVSPGDSASGFVRSGTIVGTDCSDSGLYPVFKIAGEHDNLFTAIYPIVFRADIAAACFNYPFQGVPFSNLTESVPTTAIILGTYSSVRAQWFKEVGVVGNAHNSWAGHRPRWHLVLMAEVLAIARDAGVNPQQVWKWLQVHRGLFKDAVDIAISKKATAHISPHELETAYAMFREPISLPKDLKVSCDRL